MRVALSTMNHVLPAQNRNKSVDREMRLWFLFLLICGIKAAASYQHSNEVCGKRYPLKKGDEVVQNYPWLATIYMERSNQFLGVRCVGTIIHSRAIVTSAWCVQKIPSLYQPAVYKVVVGKQELNMDKEEDGEQILNIIKIHFHENYLHTHIRYQNDIAIIVVNEEIKFNSVVVPVCIDLDRKLKLYNHTQATGMIVSWNTMECHCQQSAYYQYISNRNCSKLFGTSEDYQKFVTAEKFCGKFVNGTHFEHNSHVGAGLIFSTKLNEGHYLYGTVSNGQPPNTDIVTITSIESSLHWISHILDTIYYAGGS